MSAHVPVHCKRCGRRLALVTLPDVEVAERMGEDVLAEMKLKERVIARPLIVGFISAHKEGKIERAILAANFFSCPEGYCEDGKKEEDRGQLCLDGTVEGQAGA